MKEFDQVQHDNEKLAQEKQTAISQLERVKRGNKDLSNSNHLLKQELENLNNQVMILEEEKVGVYYTFFVVVKEEFINLFYCFIIKGSNL